jgi:hydrogenase expression/formation protein HypC
MTERFSFAERGAPTVLPVVPVAGASCASEQCITCGDIAVEVTVVRLLPHAMAVVDTGVGEEEVSIALVEAVPGDVVLVHAGEAITTIRR